MHCCLRWRRRAPLLALCAALFASSVSITNVFPYAPFMVKHFGLYGRTAIGLFCWLCGHCLLARLDALGILSPDRNSNPPAAPPTPPLIPTTIASSANLRYHNL